MTEPPKAPGASARAGRPPAQPLPWMDDFLAALGASGNIRHACRLAGVSQTTVYDARKRHAEFDAAWKAAIAGKEYGTAGFRRHAPLALVQAPTEPARGTRWREPFLQALAETSNVLAAAAAAGVAPQQAYQLRRKNPAFAARWLDALDEGYGHLELELLGHLRDPAPARKMDVSGALRLLAAHRAAAERRRAWGDDESEQAVLESIDRFIDDIRARREADMILIEAGPSDGAQ